jgi:recombination protein RecR
MNYPKDFINLMESFKTLPGIGDKSAERFVYAIDTIEKKEIEEFANNLLNFKKNIKKCSICGHYADKDICSICSDKNRNNEIICVVEDSKSVFMFEKTGNYRGKYHVLNGLISPIDGINPEDVNIEMLINNRITPEVKEVIIAINPSIEGETTSLYIQRLLKNKNIKISRFSYGIPVGSDIEYLDPLMISKALEDRKEVS